MLQNTVDTVTLGSIYLLFALGLSLAWGTIGILNFAHGTVFMFSAFISYEVVGHARLGFIPLLLIGAATGAALSALIQLLVFGPIQKFAKNPVRAELQILVGGIGVASILLAIAQRVTKSAPFGLSASSFRIEGYHFGSARTSNLQIVITVVAVGLALAIGLWLRYTRAGLALRAIGVDSEVATMMGVNRSRLALLTMSTAGALAGLAGVLLTFYLNSIAPESGDDFLLKAFAAIVLGGVGSVLGAAVGALVLAIAETLVITQTSGTWVNAVSFGLIFVMLMLRPNGLFGRREVRRT